MQLYPIHKPGFGSRVVTDLHVTWRSGYQMLGYTIVKLQWNVSYQIVRLPNYRHTIVSYQIINTQNISYQVVSYKAWTLLLITKNLPITNILLTYIKNG